MAFEQVINYIQLICPMLLITLQLHSTKEASTIVFFISEVLEMSTKIP